MEFLIECKLVCLLIFLGWEAWIDSREQYIDVRDAVIFEVVGILFSLCLERYSAVLTVLLGSIPGVLMLVTARMTNEAIGYGDGLVLIVCGCYLGVGDTAAMLFLALFLCMPYILILLVSGKAGRKTEIAFAPFLLVAYVCWIGFMK
ncbi:MAG: prepilin peptidase [Muricoprocola sp.]